MKEGREGASRFEPGEKIASSGHFEVFKIDEHKVLKIPKQNAEMAPGDMERQVQVIRNTYREITPKTSVIEYDRSPNKYAIIADMIEVDDRHRSFYDLLDTVLTKTTRDSLAQFRDAVMEQIDRLAVPNIPLVLLDLHSQNIVFDFDGRAWYIDSEASILEGDEKKAEYATRSLYALKTYLDLLLEGYDTGMAHAPDWLRVHIDNARKNKVAQSFDRADFGDFVGTHSPARQDDLIVLYNLINY